MLIDIGEKYNRKETSVVLKIKPYLQGQTIKPYLQRQTNLEKKNERSCVIHSRGKNVPLHESADVHVLLRCAYSVGLDSMLKFKIFWL